MTRSTGTATERARGRVPGRLLRLLSAGLLVNTLLLAPQWLLPAGGVRPWAALEAWAVVALLALLPSGRWQRRAVAFAAAILTLCVAAVAADVLLRQSLGRPLNLYLDVALASALFRLMAGTLGTVAAIALTILAALGAVALTWGLVRLIAPGAATSRRFALHTSAAAAGVLLVCVLAATVTLPAPMATRVDLPVTRIVQEQARTLPRMFRERERFAAEMAALPRRADLAGPELLSRLGGRDVILGFVESYGISALTDPRYSGVVVPGLRQAESALAAAGLHMATGTLMAPSQGGQSWLGRGSILSGLWLDNQLRYDLLMSERPDTLVDDFRAAGYRSAALMPAITLAWPEGEQLGYDRIWARSEIDYAGPPLNWVTMPDQFTWSFLQRQIRSDDDPRPLFAEVGLISSHAPWTPILEVLDDWDSIGDGSVFESWTGVGEEPVDLWRDHDRVREHYALSIGYALAAAFSWAERFVDDDTLLIVLGDHQPAPMITGEDASRAVPVHVISRSAELIEPFLQWGFVAGALPADDATPRGMEAFRPWFLRAFSTPPEDVQASEPAPAHEAGGSDSRAPAAGEAPGV
jgi:hypothetical protein